LLSGSPSGHRSRASNFNFIFAEQPLSSFPRKWDDEGSSDDGRCRLRLTGSDSGLIPGGLGGCGGWRGCCGSGCGAALAGGCGLAFGAIVMAIRAGRAGVAGQVVALVPGLLEVGFVPAAAGQAEHRRAEHVLQLLGVAVGTHLRVRVRQLLQVVKTMAARATLEFIDGHAYSSYPVPGQA